MTYEPKSYWQDRGRYFQMENPSLEFPGKVELVEILERCKPVSLLDTGCGWGRLFHLYKDVPRVLAIDFSSSMLEHAEQTREKLGLKNIELKLWALEDLVSLNEKFDFILSRNVLMHVKPRDIGKVVENVKACSSRWIFLLEYFGPSAGLASHNFSHDYLKLFSDMKVEQLKDVDGNTLFLFEVDEK